MGKRKLKTVFWVFLLLIVTGLIGCKQKEPEKEQLCHIVMEKGDGYQVTDPVRTIKSGSNVSFTVTLDNNWQLLGTDYHGETEIIKDDDGKTVEIVLHEVKYSESICIQAEKGKYEILYDANGGQNTSGDSDRASICYRGTHQRINTSIGTDLFFRKGYTLLGWNTRADGSGQAVGLGSRIAWKAGLVLYAQWTPWTDEADFIYKKVSGFAVITGYSGKAQQICIPPSLGGLPVRTIRENAFADTDCKTVILSPGIYEIEKWAFRNSHLEQLYLYDDLEKISDYAFQDCDMLHTLHINAIEAPAYSGNYFDTFQDKYDRLLSMKDKKKIVLFSGSSTRFGYDSEMIDQAFPDYEVVNMGVFAYSPALPQLELIRSCMKEGDVLLDSPEFDAANRQFCYQKELDYATFAMMESDYDVFVQLDLREYKQIFTAFTAYQDARADMERKNYDVCALDYDEDGNSTPLIIYPKEESIEQEKFHVDPSKTERIYGAAPILPTRAENGWTSSYLNEIFSQDAPTDMTEVRFLDINDDGQPEFWLDYGYGYAGGEVFTTDGSTTDKVYLSHGAAYTIPGSNLLHTTGGHMGGYYDEIYKIENGKFATVAKGSYGETEDQQTDENGELIYRYYWNGENVSEEQYEQNLKELFDQDQAEDIYQNIYTFEQSKALLQQMM